jgi:hypothetical protein
MSLASATLWGAVANWGLLVSLVGGVVSTYVVVKTTDVKEHHWEQQKKQAEERIAANETETARAVAESNRAIERAAEAQRKTAEAELELLRLRTPRRLNAEIFATALKSKSRWPIIELWFLDASDCGFFAMDIATQLSHAGWAPPMARVLQGSNSASEFLAYQTPVESRGASATGVSIVAKTIEDDSPQQTLMMALSRAMPGWQVNGGRDSSMREGTLRIVVAPRM